MRSCHDDATEDATAARLQTSQPGETRRKAPLVDAALLRAAIADSFVKLDPRHMVRNPVMFVVEVGAC